MINFTIKGTPYQFYDSHFIKYGLRSYVIVPKQGIQKIIYLPEPHKILVFTNMKDDIYLLDDGRVYFRKGGVGVAKDAGLVVNEGSIANKAQITTEGTGVVSPPSNGGIVPGGGGEPSATPMGAGFPVGAVIVGVGVLGLLAFLFFGMQKKRKRRKK